MCSSPSPSPFTTFSTDDDEANDPFQLAYNLFNYLFKSLVYQRISTFVHLRTSLLAYLGFYIVSPMSVLALLYECTFERVLFMYVYRKVCSVYTGYYECVHNG